MASGRDMVLSVPAARQGPGPMPAALVDALAPALSRLISRTLPGVSRSSGVGQGTELAQLRPYETGDDVRHLDASASARTGVMHVRLNVPERALTTWIVLDLSPSMAFGTAGRLKADVAEGVGLVFGRLGVRSAGSLGVIAFGAGPVGPGTPAPATEPAAGPPASQLAVGAPALYPPAPSDPSRASVVAADPLLRVLAPRGAKPGLAALGRLLGEGVNPDGQHAPGALAAALIRLGRLAGQPGLVVILSDFRGQRGWEGPLGGLALRHSVIAVEISDPRERELPAVGRLALVDPESGRLIQVDTSNRRLRERFAAIETQRRELVHRELRRLRVHHVSLSTDGPWLRDLGRGLG
ncbi:MAG TPA: DUF58 domain-containing protein [Solirubrobacteraceae bacterium]|nr:DUF58 domain-containing protein [Solirubrobacteraceae bacterium]